MKRNSKVNPELDLIEQIQTLFPSKSRTVALGIGDDCAILRPPPGHEIVVTTDFTLEDRHFRRKTHPAAAVGHRTLIRGLSDLAAMGAMPLAAFLSLALPSDLPRTGAGRRWIRGFLNGLHALAQTAKVTLAGGDTAQAPGPHILADIVMLGTAPTGTALRRSTARAGDLLYVTGSLGGAAAELNQILSRTTLARARPSSPHLYPQPRLAVGSTLRRRKLATAAIDLSDGLSTDLTHLCEASHLRAEIDATQIPLHPMTAGNLYLGLHGGEDYELLFAANPATRIPSTIAGTPITRIGQLLRQSAKESRITLLQPDRTRQPLAPGGWQHFKT